MLPGPHVLISPLNQLVTVQSVSDSIIKCGPISLIRVLDGQLGFAYSNGEPEVLLPGVHARMDGAFIFKFFANANAELIEFGPIKFITVLSGNARVCFQSGKVAILRDGRYAVNSPSFVVSDLVDLTQETIKFDNHTVLLDGGVSLTVQGLLTYQVVDVERLVLQLGSGNLKRSLTDVVKAEFARVFSTLHLDEISSQHLSALQEVPGPRLIETVVHEPTTPIIADLITSLNRRDLDSAPPSPATTPRVDATLLSHVTAPSPDDNSRNQMRSWIMQSMTASIAPMIHTWGVSICNFQLENLKITDKAFAANYELQSLVLATAKANLRAVLSQNQIKILKAQTQYEILQISAKAASSATVIKAEGGAEARRIDAASRNAGAAAMPIAFARAYAMQGLNVDLAKELKAAVVTVAPLETLEDIDEAFRGTGNSQDHPLLALATKVR